MHNILLENKVKVLERLVLQDIVESHGKQKPSEKSYDVLMAKFMDRLTRFYDELEPDAVSLRRLNQYGDRAKIYMEQLRHDLDEAAQVTVRQVIKQLPREKLFGRTKRDVIQAVRPVLKKRMEVLSNLLSASALQMQNYMLLWDYQDAGFTHYCLLTEGENCDSCNSLEGQIFPISEARVGENFAPMHANCNCRVGVLDAENRIVAVISEGQEHEPQPDDRNIKKWLDSISNVLTAASLIPGVDTFTNLASIPVDIARGDFVSAGLSALGMVPFVGEIGDTAKLAKVADKAVDATKVVDKVADIDKLSKKTSIIAKRSPIKIPKKATIQVQAKSGYSQIKYTRESGNYKYTSRWHTRTPNAPKNQGTSWVVERKIPGVGYGKNFRKPKEEVLVGKNKWISKDDWREAIKAKNNGIATKKQKEWLDNGHWKD